MEHHLAVPDGGMPPLVYVLINLAGISLTAEIILQRMKKACSGKNPETSNKSGLSAGARNWFKVLF